MTAIYKKINLKFSTYNYRKFSFILFFLSRYIKVHHRKVAVDIIIVPKIEIGYLAKYNYRAASSSYH